MISRFESKVNDMRLISYDAYKESDEFEKTMYKSTLKLSKEKDNILTKTVDTLDFRENVKYPIITENEKMIIEDDFIDTKNSPFYFNDLQPCPPILTNFTALEQENERDNKLNFKSRFR